MKKLFTLFVVAALFSTLVNGEIVFKNKQRTIWKKQQITSYILIQKMDKQIQNTFVEKGVANAMTIDNLLPQKDCKLVSFYLRTVDDIFNLVDKLKVKHGDNLEVKYHSELGYPQKIGVQKGNKTIDLLEIKDVIFMVSE